MIAIYESAASAQKLIDASPIRFELQDGKSELSPLRGSLNSEESNSPTDPSRGPQSKIMTSNPLPGQASDILAQIPVPPSATTFDPPPPRPPREYQLTISPSNMDHATYIERQGYYGGYNTDNGSIMAEDLEGRVPMHGLIDCQIRRAEAPGRVVAKWRDRAAQKKTTLQELWENGKKARGG